MRAGRPREVTADRVGQGTPALAARKLLREGRDSSCVRGADRVVGIAGRCREQQRPPYGPAQLVLVDSDGVAQAGEQGRACQGRPLALGVRGEGEIDITQLGHGRTPS